MEYNDIGENIRKYRKRLNLTQDKLGDRIGVSWEMISRYERGESSPMNKLHKLANALGISIIELVGNNENRSYDAPLFTKIPTNFSFTKENTLLYYNCPRWLKNLDPDTFIIDSMLISNKVLISEKQGFLFISPNIELYNSDLILTGEGKRLLIEKYNNQEKEVLGKLMMQELIFHNE